jgi:uncharacterized membrane protein YfcA
VPVEHVHLIVATLTFLLAGFVKGVIGLGLPTVSMGLLSLVMAPAKAASLLIVPSFVTMSGNWRRARVSGGWRGGFGPCSQASLSARSRERDC